MSKFHITRKGEVGTCRATQGRCPYGSEDQHFVSRQDAEKALSQQVAMGEIQYIKPTKKIRFKKEQLRAAETSEDSGVLLDVAERIQPNAHGFEIARRLVANEKTPPTVLVEARARTIDAYEQFAFIESSQNYPLSNLTQAGAMEKVHNTNRFKLEELAGRDDVGDHFFEELARRYPQLGAIAAANLNNKISGASIGRVAALNTAVAEAAAKAGRWPTYADASGLNNFYSNAHNMTGSYKARPQCLVFAAKYSKDLDVLKTLGMRFGINTRNFDENVIRTLIENPALDPSSKISFENALKRNTKQ